MSRFKIKPFFKAMAIINTDTLPFSPPPPQKKINNKIEVSLTDQSGWGVYVVPNGQDEGSASLVQDYSSRRILFWQKSSDISFGSSPFSIINMYSCKCNNDETAGLTDRMESNQ